MTNTTSSTNSTATSKAGPRPTRPPAPALAASALTVLVALAGGYGAIYFTGLEGWDDLGITFVTAYEAIVIFALASAIALARGSGHGRVGLVAYGIYNVGFTVMKLVTIQEWEAIIFGIAGAAILVLALHPRTRAFAP